jgi:hypothetical protein
MSAAAGMVVTEMNTPMRALARASVSDTTPTQAIGLVGRADQPHVKSHGLSSASVVWVTGTGPRDTIVSPASGAGVPVCVTAAS